jgi:hypothetical protein
MIPGPINARNLVGLACKKLEKNCSVSVNRASGAINTADVEINPYNNTGDKRSPEGKQVSSLKPL